MNESNPFPGYRELTPQEITAVLAAFDKHVDFAEAEEEYLDTAEQGGVPWEQLMRELEAITNECDNAC